MGKYIGFAATSQNVGEEVISGLVNVGASGAVSSTDGDGFSIARSAAGRYTITLKRKYKALVGCTGEMVYAAYGSIDKLEIKFSNEAVDGSTPTIMLLVRPGDSTTLTDPTSGDAFTFTLRLLKSQVSA
jgi:hypothetical protein